MFAPDPETRIGKLAHAQGFLPDGGAWAPPAETLADAGSLWGPRLASLVETGHLSQQNLNALAWEAISGAAGSWADPIVKGPAPLGNLPGLGNRYQDPVLVGEGATAQVFKVLDTLLQRPVALKVLRDDGGPALAEARAQAQVEHPNVCRVYEVGAGYLVLQLVEGPSLASLAPALTLAEKVRIVRDLALGVHAAHGCGLLHLDLKLDNVLVQRDERGALVPMVSDFGMAITGRSRAATCPMGTPPYTSPEQLAGNPERVDCRADVYALGVMLYILLCAAIPFVARDFQGLMAAMAKARPVPPRQRVPGLPEDLSCLVLRCLEKDPGRRYPTALHLAEDLDRFLACEAMLAMGPAPLYRLGRWVRRNRRVAWVGAVALLVLVATTAGMLRHLLYVRDQAEWDHHFQNTVAELRVQLDHAYRLPAHPLTGELRAAEARVRDLEAEVRGLEASAQGPGQLALGQALLLLDPDGPEAILHLKAAWDLGFRTEPARAWLALTQIQAFREARAAAHGDHDWAEAEGLVDQARERYLKAAGRLLTGRGGADQARLAHLIRMADLKAHVEWNPELLLQEAQAYRARFPDDVDALLEEADALNLKASTLWMRHQTPEGAWPPACAAEVEPLRAASWSLLQEAHRIAPSHPRVYEHLAWAVMEAARQPTEATPAYASLLQQAGQWFTQGLAVAPADAGLVAGYAGYLGGMATTQRLQRHLDPQPIADTLLDLLDQGLAAGDGQRQRAAFIGLMDCSARWGEQGLANAGPLLAGFEHLGKAQPPGRITDFYCLALRNGSLTLARLLLDSGGDPQPVLDFPSRFLGASLTSNWYLDFEGEMIRARYALARGGDPAPALGRAEASLARRRPFSDWKVNLDVTWLTLQALAQGRAQDWAALEAVLPAAERVAAGVGRDSDLLPILEAQLALARNRPDRAGVFLKGAERTLQAAEGRVGMPGHLWHECRAERLLLEARGAKSPAGLLQEGLRETELALVYAPAGAGRFTPAHWLRGPHQGSTWALQGELCLAMAEATPAGRRTWARRALQAFARARARNANLDLRLAPLQDQARGLVGPDPSTIREPAQARRPPHARVVALPPAGPHART